MTVPTTFSKSSWIACSSVLAAALLAEALAEALATLADAVVEEVALEEAALLDELPDEHATSPIRTNAHANADNTVTILVLDMIPSPSV